MENRKAQVAIIGAGPAGLTAGYLLSKQGISVVVLEADPQYVGGIARTAQYKGYCFDIGGHRFFSKSNEVENLWSEILPHDLLTRPRSSCIYYRKRFFTYPLSAFDALYKLGLGESLACFISYLRARLFPIKPARTFADWVTNHFGQRLFHIFFKTYTEKVWGMPCEDISADWAAQRIKGLSLYKAVTHAVFKKTRNNQIKSLIETFRYPRKGPGMLWEACAQAIRENGGQVLLGSCVGRCEFDTNQALWKIAYTDPQQQICTLSATQLISSAPLRELVLHFMQPQPSPAVLAAARGLHYRDFLIVVLIVKDQARFNDNWIYVHDANVDVARIQNFKSWSPEMVPDANTCCYGMEYFCFEKDGLWSENDQALIAKASQELVSIGLAKIEDILDGCVVRQAKAYPVYDHGYEQHVHTIRDELETLYPGLHLIGRNGMHKYNNQDHAMMTAMLTVKNIVAGERQYDVWRVNQDAEYLEEECLNRAASGLRAVPQRV